ncbi:hypothetical protein Drorol1_Dr00011859 [Drosera rotundifolia]
MGGHGERTRDTMTWPREVETTFIGILYERLKKGKLQCSTFTKDEWGKINEELKAVTKWDYGIERLKGKWHRLRIAHRSFTSLIEHTGVTWDPNTNEVHAAEEVWNHFYTVPETLPENVLTLMGAPPKSDVPFITPDELGEADGFLFGFPTRFGMMAAQFKAFLDSTGGLWRTQKLVGKPAGIFISTSSQGGGQETTTLPAITQLGHHGMIFVPIGYTFGAGMFEMEKIKGGSAYGAGTYAGDGTRQPSELELAIAFH